MLVNLESLFDMDELKTLDEEMCLGIATSELRIPTPGINQIGVKDPGKIIRKYNNSDKISHLTSFQQRMFMKLYDRAFLPAQSVYIRNHINNYSEKWIEDKCEWHKNSIHFPKFIKWLNNSNVFESIGRIEIFMVDMFVPIPMHEDRSAAQLPDDPKEFIWININGDKPFWCIDDDGNKVYLGRVAWFDDEILHGSDPINWMAYSFRIDGIFTEEFRKQAKAIKPQIPYSHGAKSVNPLWGNNWLEKMKLV